MSVKLPRQKISIQAPREMVFQMLAALGRGKLPGASGESVRVLQQQEDTIVAQFTTRVGRRTVNTVEEVKLYPPERLTFSHLAGPLDCSWELMVLEEKSGATELEYQGEFDYHFPPIGWFIAHFYIKPRYHRAVRGHLLRIKEAAEQRAQRSHVFGRGGEAATG